MISLTEFKKQVKGRAAMESKYKSYLQVLKDETDTPWYNASKEVFKLLHPEISKPSPSDYEIINRLRSWYEQSEEV